MQTKETPNQPAFSDNSPAIALPPSGRIIALDPGAKRVGAAVCDETRLAVRALPALARKSWKELLKSVKALLTELDAVGLVLGLPLNLDGSESAASAEARRLEQNFSLSLEIPVFLHDERLTSFAAEQNLREQGLKDDELKARIDSESAALILEDFLSKLQNFPAGAGE